MFIMKSIIPAGINLLKVNSRNTRTRCEMCSKLTIKIPLLFKFEQISHLVSIVNFEHVITGWDGVKILFI